MLDEEDLIGVEALYESKEKCARGVSWKNSVARFVLNGLEECIKLSDELKNNTYKAGKPTKVKIMYPKEREAVGARFRDRVYQRSLNDNALYPSMVENFITYNCACQKGKGTDMARDGLKMYLRECYAKHGRKFYIAQTDIKGYYANMTHESVNAKFRQHCEPMVSERCIQVLKDQYAGDKGYNPGSQMVQIAGIALLDDLDHYIVEVLGIKHYIRYMDDLLLIHHDKAYLELCLKRIGVELDKLGLWLHPTKTHIKSADNTIRFLGFDFRLTKQGYVVMSLDPANTKHERKKLVRLANLCKAGIMPMAKVIECYAGWRNHASKGNSNKLIMRMDKFVSELLGGVKLYEYIKTNHRFGQRKRAGNIKSRKRKITR